MARTELVVALGDHLYAVERYWEKLPEGIQFTLPAHIALDSQDNVYVFQRGDLRVLIFDSAGNYLRGWGGHICSDAHGIFITPDDQVWLVDRDGHQVLKFDTQGNLLLALGERHRPRLQRPFNHPAGVAVAPSGDVYVADGYGNSVVHRFSSQGELIRTWGRPGTGPGEFTTPHAVWVDRDNRVLVADRENNRVQIFDEEGEYLTEWGDFYHPMDIYLDKDGMAYITDQIPRVSMVAPDGTLVGRGRPVPYNAHSLWGDSQGNLFLAEMRPERVTKLVRLD